MTRLRPLLLLAAALAAGCGDPPEADPAPLDRFTFPVGIAAYDGDLLVVSSNFDLTYNQPRGGSVLRVDPAVAPAAIDGGVRIPSYGGEIAIADAAACGLAESQAVVVSRSAGEIYRLGLGDGTLTCGADCKLPLGAATQVASDPYGVAVVCAPERPPLAYVGFLRGSVDGGLVAAVNLETGEVAARTVASGPPRSFAYDAETSRLFFTGPGIVPSAPLLWFELSGGCTIGVETAQGGCPLAARDLSSFVRGVDLQGLALSNPQDGLPRRLYVAGRLYDADLAALLGGRPGFDVGGVLLVLDLVERRTGDVEVRLVRMVSTGLGVSEVRVLPTRSRRACAERPVDGCPRRDVVAVTATGDGLLWLYDDELGAVAKVFGADDYTGAPLIGRQPFGLAVAEAGAGEAIVYVASFNEAFVTAVRVPLDDPGAADPDPPGPETRRIGAEVP